MKLTPGMTDASPIAPDCGPEGTGIEMPLSPNWSGSLDISLVSIPVRVLRVIDDDQIDSGRVERQCDDSKCISNIDQEIRIDTIVPASQFNLNRSTGLSYFLPIDRFGRQTLSVVHQNLVCQSTVGVGRLFTANEMTDSVIVKPDGPLLALAVLDRCESMTTSRCISLPPTIYEIALTKAILQAVGDGRRKSARHQIVHR